MATNYTYDTYGMGRLTGLTTAKGTTKLQDLTYDWYSRPNTNGLTIGAITQTSAPATSLMWLVVRPMMPQKIDT